uniref:Hypotheticial protein n=1 Tax=Schistosoma japonicum TaxID=6182 RepID=C1LE98_SCHJA|nr:hypotheticial protein [Schistosoma japonicum]
MKSFCGSHLVFFIVIQIPVVLSNCSTDEWSIICTNNSSGTICCDKLCCQGNSCTFSYRASGSGEEILEQYRRKVRMAERLKTASQKLTGTGR